jgi:hypothetical protein
VQLALGGGRYVRQWREVYAAVARGVCGSGGTVGRKCVRQWRDLGREMYAAVAGDVCGRNVYFKSEFQRIATSPP